MIYVFNIAVILMVGLIAYWWGNQGLLSAILHLVCVVIAGAVAFAVWEPITVSFLLRGKPWELLFDGVRIEDVDKAYAEPPHSTREILHPEQYWDAARRASMRKVQLPDLLPALGKGWTRTAEGSVGELGLTLMTGSELVTGGFQMLLPTRWTTPGAAGTKGYDPVASTTASYPTSTPWADRTIRCWRSRATALSPTRSLIPCRAYQSASARLSSPASRCSKYLVRLTRS